MSSETYIDFLFPSNTFLVLCGIPRVNDNATESYPDPLGVLN